MLKIENVVLPSPAQWEAIIRGTRNPMNSWDNSDSYITHVEDQETLETADYAFFVGDKDLDLMNRLASAGPTHGKFKRMIPVYLDITAPLYWWKEFDTYKVGTVANSCSTMHKIHAKEFTLEDFSTEHLKNFDNIPYSSNALYEPEFMQTIECIISMLNTARTLYLESKDSDPKLAKEYWWQMIQLLPSSYNQRRTVMLNYEVLTNIYQTRRNHKLDEWHVVCDWIQTLPYSELIMGEKKMSEIKGALVVCDRCGLAKFAKTSEYGSVDTPRNWHRAYFDYAHPYNLCANCYELLVATKESFFSPLSRDKIGVIEMEEKQ